MATRNTQFSFSGFFNVKDYNRIIPDWYRQRIDHHPYDLCLLGFFEGLLFQTKNRWVLPYSADTRIAFFFDQSNDPKWQRSVHTIFDGVKALRDKDHRMGTIAFADMKDTLPLQAADMLAYRIRQVLTKVLVNKANVSKNAFDAVLAPDEKLLNITYYDVPQLKQMAADLERDRSLFFEAP